MTTARRKRKQYRGAAGACAGLAVLRGLVLRAGGQPADGVCRSPPSGSWSIGIPGLRSTATTRWHSSPTASRVAGSADYELHYGGVVWRFAISATAQLSPRGPMSTCRNMAATTRSASPAGSRSPGNPNAWLIIGERLFLFYDDDRREKFAANPDRVIDAGRCAMAGRCRQPHALSCLTARRRKPGIKSSSVAVAQRRCRPAR